MRLYSHDRSVERLTSERLRRSRSKVKRRTFALCLLTFDLRPHRAGAVKKWLAALDDFTSDAPNSDRLQPSLSSPGNLNIATAANPDVTRSAGPFYVVRIVEILTNRGQLDPWRDLPSDPHVGRYVARNRAEAKF